MNKLALLLWVSASFIVARADAQIIYNNDFPTSQMATASRPASGNQFEIESADDFVLTLNANITGATFTGLVPHDFNLSNIGSVVVEIYRVFPNDSLVSRTSGPPTFSTVNVPTRVNSPSDVALDSRESGSALSVSTSLLSSNFLALNSIQPGGIHPKPGQTTGGNGSITGDEVRFTINFTSPFSLAPGHYFFVPQVALTGENNPFFLWLSANRPITAAGTPFPPGFTDLQAWTRDGSDGGIDPDWLREGTDIVGEVQHRPLTRRFRSRARSLTPARPLCCSAVLWLHSPA